MASVTMTLLETLIADLQALNASNRVFLWTGWDKDPFEDGQFRQYLMPSKDLLALLTGQAPPPPATIRVKVNASAGLRVRRAPVDGEVVGKLANGAIVEVSEIMERAGWYQISAGTYAGMYISAEYVAGVTRDY